MDATYPYDALIALQGRNAAAAAAAAAPAATDVDVTALNFRYRIRAASGAASGSAMMPRIIACTRLRWRSSADRRAPRLTAASYRPRSRGVRLILASIDVHSTCPMRRSSPRAGARRHPRYPQHKVRPDYDPKCPDCYVNLTKD